MNRFALAGIAKAALCRIATDRAFARFARLGRLLQTHPVWHLCCLAELLAQKRNKLFFVRCRIKAALSSPQVVKPRVRWIEVKDLIHAKLIALIQRFDGVAV